MGLTSLQVCMDSPDWFQGTMPEEPGMDSSSPSALTDPMLACSRPLMERRLRPQHDQALKCPRCDSTHTKFCYYNNYSLTQPRYFCKTCRRYWTKGGTLRNIPVGGGCRKNKKVSSASKKASASINNNNSNNNNDNSNSNNNSNSSIIHHLHQNHLQNSHLINVNPHHNHNHNHNHNHHQLIMNSTDLQLSYPESSMQFSGGLFGIGNMNGNASNINIPGFMFENLGTNGTTRAIEFMENGGVIGGGLGMMNGGGYGAEMGGVNVMGQGYHGGNLCSPFGGMTLDSINNPFMERGLIGYNHEGSDVNEDGISSLDVKPKLLALEWQDQSGAGASASPSSGGAYMTGVGSSWGGGLVSGYGPSTTNPLV